MGGSRPIDLFADRMSVGSTAPHACTRNQSIRVILVVLVLLLLVLLLQSQKRAAARLGSMVVVTTNSPVEEATNVTELHAIDRHFRQVALLSTSTMSHRTYARCTQSPQSKAQGR